MRMGRFAGLALLGLMAGCAASPDYIVLKPQPGPPAGIDGRYRGTARLVRGDRYCPRSGPRVYEVENGSVTLSYSAGGRHRVPLTATVGPDGRLQASDGEGRLSGHLRDGVLEVTIESRQCEHRWTMHLIP